MNPELTTLLYMRYPQIFKAHTWPESRMSDDFACDDGWFDLIDTLCELLQFDTDRNGAPQVVARQVKEKFGTLRFRVGKRNDVQHGMILFAESVSGRICEVCGKPGKTIRIDRCVSTRCIEHSNS